MKKNGNSKVVNKSFFIDNQIININNNIKHNKIVDIIAIIKYNPYVHRNAKKGARESEPRILIGHKTSDEKLIV